MLLVAPPFVYDTVKPWPGAPRSGDRGEPSQARARTSRAVLRGETLPLRHVPQGTLERIDRNGTEPISSPSGSVTITKFLENACKRVTQLSNTQRRKCLLHELKRGRYSWVGQFVYAVKTRLGGESRSFYVRPRDACVTHRGAGHDTFDEYL